MPMRPRLERPRQTTHIQAMTEDQMVGFKVASIVVAVMLVAAATIGMAYFATGAGLPIWGAALGPILLVLTLWLHLKGRRK
jgi:lipopolysaccharide export LptBFGC system permease protein LptF